MNAGERCGLMNPRHHNEEKFKYLLSNLKPSVQLYSLVPMTFPKSILTVYMQGFIQQGVKLLSPKDAILPLFKHRLYATVAPLLTSHQMATYRALKINFLEPPPQMQMC